MTTIDLLSEAHATFAALLEQARQAGEPDPTAMSVATSNLAAQPSSRMVLLKQHDERGFVFYTNLDSRKGGDLQDNPYAALLFHWPRVSDGVQVRVEGGVSIVAEEEADAYFATRPRGSQMGAWASLQSETLDEPATFHERISQMEQEFADRDVPRPHRWTGLRVRPMSFEFWYGGNHRLHERCLYECDPAGHWTKRMLYP